MSSQKNKFYLPDYKNRSIVNLMSSIGGALGWKSPYNQLKELSSEELKESENIVLMVIDGLGYNYLRKKGDETTLNKYLRVPITSVFLPTTASAIPTFLTGVAPQQHALTGWFMNLKETGTVSVILPFMPRIGGERFDNLGFKIKEIIGSNAFSEKIKTKSYIIQPEKINDSDFTKYTSKKAKLIGCKNLNGFFSEIKKTIAKKGKKYIYAYWPDLDALAHLNGIGSKETEKHFEEIDKKITQFIKQIKDTNTTVIITADHGLINIPKDKKIKLENHPKLQECLTIPLCGEPRTVYCYVHPSKTKQFEKYVKTKLKNICTLYKSQDLIKNNYFGLFKPHPKLFDRVGDYILICKENYGIKDKIERIDRKKKKKDPVLKGNHGGMSGDEMIVPLIVIKS